MDAGLMISPAQESCSLPSTLCLVFLSDIQMIAPLDPHVRIIRNGFFQNKVIC
jgi:hypothetical protein